MSYRSIKFIIAALALMVTASPAQQPPCGPSELMIAGLKANYGEVPIWEGLLEGRDGDKPTPIIMFASVKTRTWTIVANPTPGTFCMMLKGSAFDYPGLPKPRGKIL